MHIFHAGASFAVEMTDDAWNKLQEFKLNHTAPKEKSCYAQMTRLLERLADIGKLRSPDQFRKEWDSIWAVKARCGLRAYGKFLDKRFVVAYVEYKKRTSVPLQLRDAINAAFEEVN